MRKRDHPVLTKIFEKGFYPPISRIDANYEGEKQEDSPKIRKEKLGTATRRPSHVCGERE
jgi:hypothetical protein